MKKPRIALVNYGMGNLRSVEKALETTGASVSVTNQSQDIKNADGVVLPGVGAFGEAVKHLQDEKLWDTLKQVIEDKKPFLGICLGLQLLFESSEEASKVKGLEIFKGKVIQFKSKSLKVPHMGWNTLEKQQKASWALAGIQSEDYFYFVHSYFPVPTNKKIVATKTNYGKDFCSAIGTDSLFASQFHPEKSGTLGLKILKNYVKKVSSCS